MKSKEDKIKLLEKQISIVQSNVDSITRGILNDRYHGQKLKDMDHKITLGYRRIDSLKKEIEELRNI